MGSLAPRFEFISLLERGPLSYEEIWELQKNLLDQVADHKTAESVIFCEHTCVITKGRRTRNQNILSSNTPIYEIERGGDVTLHSPGQLVIYPIVKLKGDVFKGGLHQYLRFCEEIVIGVLKALNLDAGRFGPTGVWIKTAMGQTKKIASIGVAVRRWVTYHGISINISNDLTLFKNIRPCDFEPSVMTSLKELGIEISLKDFEELIRLEMLRILNVDSANEDLLNHESSKEQMSFRS